MEKTTKIPKVEQAAQFREIKCSRASLFALQHEANYANSMRILADNGMRPITYQEALARHEQLIKELAGSWFWLAGNGIKQEDGYYAFDRHGNLAHLTGRETAEQKVYVSKSSGPLSIGIGFGGDSEDGIFDIVGDGHSDTPAPVIVGTRKSLDRRKT